MTFEEWWKGPREVPQTEHAAREAFQAGAASRDAEIAELLQQLAASQKREVMLRDIFKAMRGWTLNKRAHEMIDEALAATDDLSGYILCKAEPRAWSWENKNVKGNWYLSWREPEPGFNKTPLYRAKEQGK